MTVEVMEQSTDLASESDYIGLTIDLSLHDPVSKVFLKFLLHVFVAICIIF